MLRRIKPAREGFGMPSQPSTRPVEVPLATSGHTYVYEEDGEPVAALETTDKKIETVVKAASKGKEVMPTLKETQAILRLAILSKTGGIGGIVDTLEDARTKSHLPGLPMEPNHPVRLKAAELELRLMGLMGPEAGAAVEETKNETAAISAAEMEGMSVKEKRVHFLKAIRARQTGVDVSEVEMTITDEALEKLSPASVGKEYEAKALPKRILSTSKQYANLETSDSQTELRGFSQTELPSSAQTEGTDSDA